MIRWWVQGLTLLPRYRFLSSQAVQRLGELASHPEFLSIMGIEPFTPDSLARYIHNVLPLHWKGERSLACSHCPSLGCWFGAVPKDGSTVLEGSRSPEQSWLSPCHVASGVCLRETFGMVLSLRRRAASSALSRPDDRPVHLVDRRTARPRRLEHGECTTQVSDKCRPLINLVLSGARRQKHQK
jgi:hypothetical protein